MLKPFSLSCVVLSTLSFSLTVSSSAHLASTPPLLFSSSCYLCLEAFINAFVAIMLEPTFHGKCIIMAPLSFCSMEVVGIEAVVESVWQPAVARAASCAIITGYRSFPDTQLLSSVPFTVLLSQSCVKKNKLGIVPNNLRRSGATGIPACLLCLRLDGAAPLTP